MKYAVLALSAFAFACASPQPETPAPIPAPTIQSADVSLSSYEGTYSLQAPSRLISLRVWVDAQGKLSGELVGLGQQTTFRASDTPHKFLHGDADDIWVLFTVENGRATAVTMHQRGREISGPRS